MTVLDALLGFAVVAGLLTLVPGLDTALVLRSSLTRARPYAWATALGIATGAMVWGVAAAVGLSALLATSEVAYRVLTLAGAVYMLWLGGSMLWKSFRDGAPRATDDAPVTAGAPSARQGWLIGVGTNLLNPKVGVATIPQFLPDGASPLLMGALLAGVHGALSLTWFAALIVGGAYARRWLADPRWLAVIDRATGLVLVAFGGKLLGDALPVGPSAVLPARA
ncbi:threonine/homoserine/homoserine lactone efflux protein [Georgenia soli]|uniref:Threonine/homoserine/homoserine lactone efflux protein n=1 Tax=Georgenia soli TaxID=638953 RepID=A0A2A9EMY8_9MICO|nr:LysE family translocator [Georgenia soli]PFG39579.1 threonine/homoserine/homoserine lactone efflux protein [Georgenia soli]